MRVGIWTNLFGSLFRVRVHGTMRCCGREIFRRLYFILYRKTSWCCIRRVSNVCQPSLLCMCVTLVVRRWSCTTNRAALLCIFFQSVDIILGMWVPGYSRQRDAAALYSRYTKNYGMYNDGGNVTSKQVKMLKMEYFNVRLPLGVLRSKQVSGR